MGLKVLILGMNYSPEPSGNAPYTTNLAEALVERGHQVRVMTAHPHYPTWQVFDGYGGWKRTTIQEGVQLTRLAHYVPKKPANMNRLWSEVTFGLRLLMTTWSKPDVMILVSPALFSSAIALSRRRLLNRKVPVAIWVQDLYSLGVRETSAGGHLVAKAMGKIEARTLRRSDRVVVIHDRFKRYMGESLGIDTDKIEVIRNWTHLDPSPETDRREWRHHFGWQDDETVVLHAGNQGVKQGLENVVRAAQHADKKALPVRFVLLGDGNQREHLEELGRGVQRIQFLDPLPGEDYQHAMASADLLLVNEMPGLTEMAVPSKLTSYFSTGLPVIAASDEGSVTAEEIHKSGGGVRVNTGEPETLATTALSLASDRERCVTLGEAGQRYRETVLGQEAAFDQFEQLIYGLGKE